MNRHLILLLLLLNVTFAFAQEAEFTADRPGASTGPGIVAKGVVQWEQGVQYDGDGAKGSFTFSNTLLRYGLFEGVELRLCGDALLYDKAGSWSAAFSGAGIGAKIRCFEGKGAIPAISVLADFAVPCTGTSGFTAENFAPSLYLLFENSLSDRLALGYNAGAEWDGSAPSPATFLALCLECSITERIGCFVESYSYLSKAGNQYCADWGLSCMLGRKVQADVAASLDLRDPRHCWAVSLGVAWQINK